MESFQKKSELTEVHLLSIMMEIEWIIELRTDNQGSGRSKYMYVIKGELFHSMNGRMNAKIPRVSKHEIKLIK